MILAPSCNGSLNIHACKIIPSKLSGFPQARLVHGTLFVTYYAGPHRNGAVHAALQPGHPVEIMTSRITGWTDEGFALSTSPAITDVGQSPEP